MTDKQRAFEYNTSLERRNPAEKLKSQVDLSIVTISTNEGHELSDCLASAVKGFGDLNVEFFVIDNASTDNTSSLVSQYPGITLLRQEKKLGFASNNNIALRQSTGRYVLLLNPDTQLDPDTLPVMVKYMDDHPDIGASSCMLVNPDGSIQYTARMFPTPLAVFLRWVGYDKLFPKSKVLSRYLLSDWDHVTERDVDWILGAFLLVRREAMTETGMLDEAFDPLYYEDIDWCFRIKQSGWRIRYVPYVKVVHLYDRESARSLFNKMTYIHFKNIVRFFWKHRRVRS